MRKLLLALAASAVLAAPAYAQPTATAGSYAVPSPAPLGGVTVPTIRVCNAGLCLDWPEHVMAGIGADGLPHQFSTSNTGALNITGQPALNTDGGALEHTTNGALEAGGNLAGAKADLDTIAGADAGKATAAGQAAQLTQLQTVVASLSQAVTALQAIETSSAASATAANQASVATAQSAAATQAHADAGLLATASQQAQQLAAEQSTASKLASGIGVNTVIPATATDRGGTITTGGSAQTFMAANTNRRGWVLQNQSVDPLFINCSAAATTDYHSLRVDPGNTYESSTIHVGQGACSIIGANTADPFYAREF